MPLFGMEILRRAGAACGQVMACKPAPQRSLYFPPEDAIAATHQQAYPRTRGKQYNCANDQTYYLFSFS